MLPITSSPAVCLLGHNTALLQTIQGENENTTTVSGVERPTAGSETFALALRTVLARIVTHSDDGTETRPKPKHSAIQVFNSSGEFES